MRLALVAPTLPQLISPGRFFASASSSASVCYGELAATTTPVLSPASPAR